LSVKKNKKSNGNKLTPKQETFAYLVGYEKKTYTEAYKEAYNTEKMKIDTIYVAASKLAKSDKVSTRIDEFRADKLKEEKRKFKWTLSEAESKLMKVIDKSIADLKDAEENDQLTHPSTNDAIIKAVETLNTILFKISDDENELALRKAKADAEMAEIKNRILKEKVGDEDDKTIYEINL